MCHSYGSLFTALRHKLADDDSRQGSMVHNSLGTEPKHDWVCVYILLTEGERGKLSWRHLQANWLTIPRLCLCCTSVPSLYTCAPPHTDTHCITPHTFTSHQAWLPLFRYLHNDDNLGLTTLPGLMDIRTFYGRHQMEFLCICQTAVKRDLSAARKPFHTSCDIPDHQLTHNLLEQDQVF